MVLIEELPSDDEEIPEEVPTGTKGMRPALLSATFNASKMLHLGFLYSLRFPCSLKRHPHTHAPTPATSRHAEEGRVGGPAR